MSQLTVDNGGVSRARVLPPSPLPHPLENIQTQAEQECLEQFGFRWDPPPLVQSPNMSRYFWCGFPKLLSLLLCLLSIVSYTNFI